MPDLLNALDQLRRKGQLRQRFVVGNTQGPRVEVHGQPILSFASSDYLGLAQDPRVASIMGRAAARYGVGGGAAPLDSGHRHVHERLEQGIAQFVGCERALLFSAKHLAHLAAVALVGKGDAVFCDEHNQPSLLTAARHTGAKLDIYSHGDMTHLEFAMESSTAPRKLIVSDAVFPMQGDLAPVARLLDLCERHDAWLLLDDSHGFGVLGKRGRGTLSHLSLHSKNVVHVVSLGAAAGGSGAFLAGRQDLVEWIMQTQLHYDEIPALSPAVAAGLIVSLKLIEEEEGRREHLMRLNTTLRAGLAEAKWASFPSDSGIHALLLGDGVVATRKSQDLMQQNLWVPAVVPPQVTAGMARLRIVLTAMHSMADVDRLLQATRGLRSMDAPVVWRGRGEDGQAHARSVNAEPLPAPYNGE